MTSRALVLGGGGLAGIAWELAILITLMDAGIDLTEADLVVGTSAGSVVGSVALSGVDLRALMEAQLGDDDHELSGALDLMEFANEIAAALSGTTDHVDARARVAAAALAKDTGPESVRHEIIAARLPVKEWPKTPFLVTVVDALTGEFVTFDKDSGVELVDAVAGSCAVPLVWPPMTIKGRRYVDGGLRSTTNADLAAGYDAVLIVAPFRPVPSPLGGGIDDEIAAIEDKGGRVLLVEADEASLAAFGLNPLDTSTRKPSALAGVAQAERIVDQVRTFWHA